MSQEYILFAQPHRIPQGLSPAPVKLYEGCVSIAGTNTAGYPVKTCIYGCGKGATQQFTVDTQTGVISSGVKWCLAARKPEPPLPKGALASVNRAAWHIFADLPNWGSIITPTVCCDPFLSAMFFVVIVLGVAGVQLWAKPLGKGKTAALFINGGGSNYSTQVATNNTHSTSQIMCWVSVYYIFR